MFFLFEKMFSLFRLKKAGVAKFVRNYSKVNSEVIDSIKNIFGGANFSFSESVRHHYSKDESLHK